MERKLTQVLIYVYHNQYILVLNVSIALMHNCWALHAIWPDDRSRQFILKKTSSIFHFFLKNFQKFYACLELQSPPSLMMIYFILTLWSLSWNYRWNWRIDQARRRRGPGQGTRVRLWSRQLVRSAEQKTQSRITTSVLTAVTYFSALLKQNHSCA